MARLKDRENALALRKQGMSYSQIKEKLGIGKGTLSVWLKDYPLSKERIRELRDCSAQRIERFRETMRGKREKRLKEFYEQQKKIIFPLNKRELYLAGLFLYWGEGDKCKPSCAIGISNTDPSVIRFFISWANKSLNVPKERIFLTLQLYTDMSIEKEHKYWSEVLETPLSQFKRPYIKKTSSDRINHKGGFGHGTCRAKILNARLAERTMMAIQTIADKNFKMRA